MADRNAAVLTRRQRIAFGVIAALLPFFALALVEAGLRAARYGHGPLFIPAPFDSARYLVPNPRFAARYFPGDPSPPTPPSDAFLREKPANGYRLFVLGESTTAGFPFPANGTFSRVLADALRDVMPGTPVEVINLGIPATNTYTLADELPEVIAQRPDAVLIYAGHNEYYGALGSASTVRLGGNPRLVRFVLRLKRLRVAQLLQGAIASVLPSPAAPAAAGVSRMEELASMDTLRLDGVGYRRGLHQFRDNLGAVLAALQSRGIPAYVGSLASNIRDQRPFASDTGPVASNADAAFLAGHVALGAGDAAAAESLLVRARDLDLVRFRAPSEFNLAIRNAAEDHAATYVPVAEAFRSAAPEHLPGDSLFFEHVHPRPAAVVILARAFYDALAADRFQGRQADPARLAPWPAYAERMGLTAVDTAIAGTIVEALRHRWPFTPRSAQTDFLRSYRPRHATDSAAFAVVTGRATWVQAKLSEAMRLERAGDYTGAIREYRGLMRDQPWNESPFRFAARAYLSAGRPGDALPLLERAYALEATPFTTMALGRVLAADSTQLPRAVALLEQSMRIGGFNADAMYQLSLVHARQKNVTAARAAAAAVYRAAPNYPGLAEWMRLLGMR